VTAAIGVEAEPSAEPALDLPAVPFVWTPPVPVLGPYLGLVTAVLCALGGGWLLLAPYALDYRHGARTTPRTTEIDLATGAAVAAVALICAVLFAATLVRRLHAPLGAELEPEPVVELEPESAAEESEPFAPPDATAAATVPEPAPAPDALPPEPAADPVGSLRELLTPLVAALAADLKSRTDGSQGGA
jgi:hypothetical protein